MLIGFFQELRAAKVPTTLRELLDLLAALEQDMAFVDIDAFYYLSRTLLVKEEKYFDRFDKAFGRYFNGLAEFEDLLAAIIPEDWVRDAFISSLSEEDKAKIKSIGGLEKLLEEFRKRLAEQKERHQGGSKWIGTGGTSPFDAEGYKPEGIRIGQDGNRNFSALKVWDRRDYKNLDDSVELGTRNIKVALRRLRHFARTGAQDQLDMDDTIRSTAKNAGYLDIKMVPERHNAVKVLLFMDIGGSMDPHVKRCEELFSASRTEFKHLEYYYFHNMVYESLWQNNERRWSEKTPTWDILHKYGSDYRVIFVGDASMSPYEISSPGGSVEHWNDEAGNVWMKRFKETFDKVIWLNPKPRESWDYSQSIKIVDRLVGGHMYPLNIEGLEAGMKYLSK